MNAGKDYAKAKRQAQANANQTGQVWQVWFYHDVYWIESVAKGPTGELKVYDGATLIEPDKA